VSTDLNSRRSAERILNALEDRVERLITRRLPAVRYGIVDGPPDTATRKVEVRLNGLDDASPGFVYGTVEPREGDFVRVISTPAGDRYVDAILGRDAMLAVVTALPSPAVELRGRLVLLAGGTGVADTLYVCRKDATDAYVWVAV
jgi:hypothetical protein